MGALIVGRLRGGVDIRTIGSGKVGGTNALRSQGKAFAFWVMVIDIGKGVIATMVVPSLNIPGVRDRCAGWTRLADSRVRDCRGGRTCVSAVARIPRAAKVRLRSSEH